MKEQTTGKSFIALSFAGLLVKLMSLLYVPILIRILGDEGYGIYLASYDIFSLIYVVTNSGMQMAIAKQIAEFKTLNENENVIRTFEIGKKLLFIIGLVSTILLAFSSGIVARLTGSERATIAIVFLSPTIFVTSILAAYRGFFQGISNMVPMAVSQVLEQIFNIFLSVFFAYIFAKKSIEFGAAGGTIGTTLGAIIAILFLLYILKKEKIVYSLSQSREGVTRKVSNKSILKTFFKYGIPVVLTSGIQYIGAVIDLALVKNRLLVAGFSETSRDILYGLLGKYKTLIYVPLALIAALSIAVIPAIVNSVVLKDSEGLSKKISFALKVSFFISIPSCIAFLVLSKPIYSLLFSQEFSGGYTLMIFGSSLVIFMAIVQIQTTILQAINKFYMVFFSLFIGVIIKLLSNYYFISIPAININGAVIGSILGFLIPMVINIFLVKHYTGFKMKFFKDFFKPFVSAIIMGALMFSIYYGCLYLFRLFYEGSIFMYISLFISSILGGLVYILFIVIFKYISRDDLDFLPSSIVNKIPKKIMSRFFK